MHTSPQGIEALELEEGVVLKAYRDVVGVLTIGAGLTAASGVIVPKPGMTITRAQSEALTRRALAENYEPVVEMAMAQPFSDQVIRPSQQAFDAGVSFHWNTGAIRRASWVGLWKRKASRMAIRDSLMKWNRGGGKVLPALTARREREAAMLLDGVYRTQRHTAPPSAIHATWGMVLSSAEKAAVGDALRTLGYKPGSVLDAVLKSAALDFQRDHDLTADGIIGRATLSTLQRRLDARRKAKAPVATSVAAVPVATTDYADQIANLPHVGSLLLGGGVIWALILAWRYRDMVAAQIQHPLPRVAALLRSF